MPPDEDSGVSHAERGAACHPTAAPNMRAQPKCLFLLNFHPAEGITQKSAATIFPVSQQVSAPARYHEDAWYPSVNSSSSVLNCVGAEVVSGPAALLLPPPRASLHPHSLSALQTRRSRLLYSSCTAYKAALRIKPYAPLMRQPETTLLELAHRHRLGAQI